MAVGRSITQVFYSQAPYKCLDEIWKTQRDLERLRFSVQSVISALQATFNDVVASNIEDFDMEVSACEIMP